MSSRRRPAARLRASLSPALSAPPDLAVYRLSPCGDEYAVFEWSRQTRAAPDGLTQAEREVASLLLAGLSNTDVALRRATSPRTVANQVASLFRKLGIRSRLELFAAAGARTSGESDS